MYPIFTYIFFLLLPVSFNPGGVSSTSPSLFKEGRETAHEVTTSRIISSDENSAALESLVKPWLLYYTNLYRKEHGLDSLKYDACLQAAAGYHSDYLFNESQVSGQFKLVHQQEPGSKWFKGKGPSERAAAAGCQKSCGENALFMTVAGPTVPQFADKQALNQQAKNLARKMVFEQWHKSKGHRENMLTKAYTCMGVSVAIGNTQAAAGQSANQLVAFGVQVFAF
jgi:uncharacterized protein YkwD